MKEKICPKCKKKSYSANDEGKWICPYCGTDLSQVESKNAE